jgi:hypothetical protein
LAVHLDDVDPVAHQAASGHLATKFVHRGHRCVRRQDDDLVAAHGQEWVSRHRKRACHPNALPLV